MKASLGLVLVAAAATTACEGSTAPRARAQRVATSDQLIGGPKAIGEIGDYLMENDKIRVIVHGCSIDPAVPEQDECAGRGNTLYAGSIIDADLVRPGGGGGTAGNDQLAEILPAFLFEVIEPTSIRVTRDGSDGGAAEITVSGEGSDLLQLASLLVAGLLFPQNLEFEVVYRLHPGQPWVEIETSVINPAGQGAHPLPWLDPSELAQALPDIPGLDMLELSVPFGHLLLFGGEQQMFAPGTTGFNVRFAIEDAYETAGGFPAFPGLVVDHVATRGDGVSYGFAVPSGPNNYVNAFASRYAPQPVTPESFVLGFNYASVAGAYSSNPPPVIADGERFSYTAYLVVGRGDAASVHDGVLALRDVPTGRFAGRIVDQLSGAPVHLASVVISNDDGLVTQADTDAGGNFIASLAPGTYRYRVIDDHRAPTGERVFAVRAGETSSAGVVELPAPAHVAVLVVDEIGRPAPAKATLVTTFDPANVGMDPRDFLYSIALGEKVRPTAFEGTRTEYIEAVFYGTDGRISGALRPGTYDLVVSRGPEYQVHRETVTIAAGQTVTREARLSRAFATDGWIAADVHLHSGPSTDSGITLDERVLSCAAEGVELAVATEHNFIADYDPAIYRQQLVDWVTGMVGIELTTFEMGHFNAYPLRVDAGSTRGGDIVWTRQPPIELFDDLRRMGRDPDDPSSTIVQVNHPREQVLGYFASFWLDSETGDPYIPSGIRAVFSAYGDEFQPEAFSYDFDAIELITGKHFFAIHTLVDPATGMVVRGPDGRPTFPGTIETWMTLLDRGLRPTGTGSSDSHGLKDEAGYGRTMVYVGPGADVAGGYRADDIVAAIRSHRAIATNGPMIEMTIGDAMIGDDVLGGPQVTLDVRVTAPTWAEPDRIVVWSNSEKLVDQAIPGADAGDYRESFVLDLAADAWVVVEVTGGENMFPVVTAKEFEPLDASVVIKALGAGLDLSGLTPGGLKPDKTVIVTPFAITNPIWIDVDGGGFTPRLPPLSRKTAARAAAPDVRDAFRALPGGVQ